MLRCFVMSTSYIGSDALTSPITPLTVPGFDVLDPTSYAESSTSAASASLATTSPASASTTPSSSSSSGSSASTLNPYQQSLLSLDNWQAQILGQSLTGNVSDATSALYASAGLNADQFANLTTQLQNLQSAPATGGTLDTSA
jgi:hypothetical protein